MRKKAKKAIITVALVALLVALALILSAAAFVHLSNKWISVSEYSIESSRITENFNGFRIVQVSDLHNEEFGKDNKSLIDKIKKADPDIIVITGDIVDRSRTDIDVALSFAENALKTAPTYYVVGNHEASLGHDECESLKSSLRDLGVTVLENESTVIEREGQKIRVVGLLDSSYDLNLGSILCDMTAESEDYTLLLSHRPELFDMYVRSGVDLVFTGHAHGGQFIIPGIGGLYAPGQGILPEYYEGVHTEENTTMVISRGLGNSAFPLRINNRPELVVVELKHDD